MGNSLELFFGKDILVAFVYIALFVEIRRGREKTFRPPFLLFLSLFLWLGALQVFNQNSPSILYGLLGFKVYFYYVPLLFVGYALIRNDADLRKFLVVSAVLAGVISVAGNRSGDPGQQLLESRRLGSRAAGLGKPDQGQPVVQSRTFSPGFGVRERGPFRRIPGLGIHSHRRHGCLFSASHSSPSKAHFWRDRHTGRRDSAERVSERGRWRRHERPGPYQLSFSGARPGDGDRRTGWFEQSAGPLSRQRLPLPH